MLNTTNNTKNPYPSIQRSGLMDRLEDRKIFDKFLTKPDLTTCDKPRGQLVYETPLEEFASVFKDTKKDVKNLGKAFKTGKLSDHELGRLNDLGMKVGGGLIAAALIGSKNTPTTKMMEVIGFGTFFSVMSLWPKLAIDLPTKLLYGFNPHQKYIDSQGRKKTFSLDNQYLPWDLVPKEDLAKSAKKMGISTNQDGWEELVKEKRRMIMLQDNTLWMLSAGLATPLLTSLACNRIENGLKTPVANASLVSLSKQLDKMNDPNKMAKLIQKELKSNKAYKAQDMEFDAIIKSLKSGVIPDNLSDKLAKLFDPLRNCANENITENLAKAPKEQVEGILDKLLKSDATEEISADFIKALTKDGDEKAFEEATELFKKAVSKVGKISKDDDFFQVLCGLTDGADYGSWVDNLSDSFEGLSPELQSAFKSTSVASNKNSYAGCAEALENIYKGSIKPTQAKLGIYGKMLSSLDNISGEKYNSVMTKLTKMFGLKYSEIEEIRHSSEDYGGSLQKLLTEKFKDFSKPAPESSAEADGILGTAFKKIKTFFNKDEKNLESTLKTIRHESDKIETVNCRFDGKKYTVSGTLDKLIKGVDEALQGADMDVTYTVNAPKSAASDAADSVTHISSTKGFFQKMFDALSEDEKFYFKSNDISVNSMIGRLQNALELEDNIQSGKILRDWNKYVNEKMPPGDIERLTYTEENAETLYKKLREISWQSTYSEIVNKAGMSGNGDEYRAFVEAVFDPEKAGSEATKKWRQAARGCASDPECIQYPKLKLTDAQDINHNKNFAKFGESAVQSCKKRIDELYNNKTWMRRFGGITLALVGATLISQLFFGRVKNADLYIKNNDTFTKGAENDKH